MIDKIDFILFLMSNLIVKIIDFRLIVFYQVIKTFLFLNELIGWTNYPLTNIFMNEIYWWKSRIFLSIYFFIAWVLIYLFQQVKSACKLSVHFFSLNLLNKGAFRVIKRSHLVLKLNILLFQIQHSFHHLFYLVLALVLNLSCFLLE